MLTWLGWAILALAVAFVAEAARLVVKAHRDHTVHPGQAAPWIVLSSLLVVCCCAWVIVWAVRRL